MARHVVESGNRFHILVVIADGQMEEEEPTVAGRNVFLTSFFIPPRRTVFVRIT